jgi:predicted anti-sigma-YlaC factor YlaD
MSEHVLDYLNAYYDGELNANLTKRVERHLAQCPLCQEAYEDLASTSSWLQDLSIPEMASSEKMTADIALLLPREQEKPGKDGKFSVIWWIVPLVLLSVWVLIGSTQWIGNMLMTANHWGIISVDPGIFAYQSMNDLLFNTLMENMNEFIPDNIAWLINLQDVFRSNVIIGFLHLTIAMLYLSWIAMWRANQNRQRSGHSLQQ